MVPIIAEAFAIDLGALSPLIYRPDDRRVQRR